MHLQTRKQKILKYMVIVMLLDSVKGQIQCTLSGYEPGIECTISSYACDSDSECAIEGIVVMNPLDYRCSSNICIILKYHSDIDNVMSGTPEECSNCYTIYESKKIIDKIINSNSTLYDPSKSLATKNGNYSNTQVNVTNNENFYEKDPNIRLAIFMNVQTYAGKINVIIGCIMIFMMVIDVVILGLIIVLILKFMFARNNYSQFSLPTLSRNVDYPVSMIQVQQESYFRRSNKEYSRTIPLIIAIFNTQILAIAGWITILICPHYVDIQLGVSAGLLFIVLIQSVMLGDLAKKAKYLPILYHMVNPYGIPFTKNWLPVTALENIMHDYEYRDSPVRVQTEYIRTVKMSESVIATFVIMTLTSIILHDNIAYSKNITGHEGRKLLRHTYIHNDYSSSASPLSNLPKNVPDIMCNGNKYMCAFAYIGVATCMTLLIYLLHCLIAKIMKYKCTANKNNVLICGSALYGMFASIFIVEATQTLHVHAEPEIEGEWHAIHIINMTTGIFGLLFGIIGESFRCFLRCDKNGNKINQKSSAIGNDNVRVSQHTIIYLMRQYVLTAMMLCLTIALECVLWADDRNGIKPGSFNVPILIAAVGTVVTMCYASSTVNMEVIFVQQNSPT